MKRTVSVLLALLLPVLAFGQDLPAKYLAALTNSEVPGGSGIYRGLTFHAPFTDPAAPLTVYKGSALTFTRATTATYVHPTTGLITTATAGQLRIEASGALIEGARTNIVPYSEDWSNAVWDIYAGAAFVITVDNTIAPDGTLTADRLTSTTGVNDVTQNFQTIDADGELYTGSFYVKKGNSSTIRADLRLGGKNYAYGINIDTGEFTAYADVAIAASLKDAPNGFKRVAIVGLNNGVTTEMQLHLWANRSVNDNTGYNYFWGGQFEKGAFASSYIPTGATAISRNADVLTYPAAGNINSATGTVSVEVSFEGHNVVGGDKLQQGVIGGGADGADVPIYRSNNNPGLTSYTGAGSLAVAVGTLANNYAPYKIALSWGGKAIAASVNSGAVLTGTFVDSPLVMGTNPFLGNDPYVDQMWGWIKNVRLWNRNLSDDELQAMTR